METLYENTMSNLPRRNTLFNKLKLSVGSGLGDEQKGYIEPYQYNI